jgi:hypothetical protein
VAVGAGRTGVGVGVGFVCGAGGAAAAAAGEGGTVGGGGMTGGGGATGGEAAAAAGGGGGAAWLADPDAAVPVAASLAVASGTGVPQRGQKRAPAASCAPQFRQ